MLLEGEYKKLEEELKSTKSERDQYKTELDKIAGVRRKISHTTGTAPASTDKGKRGDNGGLSIHNLDVRKTLNDYDWDDTSRRGTRKTFKKFGAQTLGVIFGSGPGRQAPRTAM